MNIVQVIDHLYGGPPVRLNPTACLRPRSRHHTCDACGQNCPAGAIRLEAGLPELNPEACTGCGICQGVCPTGALQVRGLDPVNLLELLGTGPVAVVRCGQAKVAAGEEHDDHLQIPCLAALDPETLAAMALGRRLVLVLPGQEAADQCPLQGCGQLQAHRQQAEEILQALGQGGEIRIATPAQMAAQAARKDRANTLDRRRFFQLARRQVGQTVSELVRPEEGTGVEAGGPGAVPVPGSAGPAANLGVPPGRQALLTRMRAAAAGLPRELTGSGLPFAAVQAAPGCDGCDACSRSCPTGALSAGREGETWTLSHRSDRCVGCGICVDACPRDLLSLTASVESPALLSGTAATLASLDMARCPSCGTEYPAQEGQCPECAKRSAFARFLLG